MALPIQNFQVQRTSPSELLQQPQQGGGQGLDIQQLMQFMLLQDRFLGKDDEDDLKLPNGMILPTNVQPVQRVDQTSSIMQAILGGIA